LAAGLGKPFTVRNYPKLPLLQTFLTIRNRNGDGFGGDGGDREGPEGADDRLAAAGVRLIVEGLAEADPRHEGDREARRDEEPSPEAAASPRGSGPAHGL
jgi:hypothetical protein